MAGCAGLRDERDRRGRSFDEYMSRTANAKPIPNFSTSSVE